jgi:hypothetical protein
MQVHKEYVQAFLLEPTKLTRIVDKIHERLADHKCTTSCDHFEVFLSGKRREERTSVDEVLALENSHKHRILRLVVTCSTGRKGAARLEHEIKVDFGGEGTGSHNKSQVTAISIRSDTAGWPGRALSELEEQVERTWLGYLQPILILCGLLCIALIILLLEVFALSPPPGNQDVVGTMWLRERDLDRVEQILAQNRPITDEEAREVTTLELRNALEYHRQMRSPQPGRNREIACVVIPLIVVVVSGFVLLVTCYPKAVFLWGDGVERYNHMLQRRKALWSIVIGVPIVGLLSNILIIGVASWLPN